MHFLKTTFLEVFNAQFCIEINSRTIQNLLIISYLIDKSKAIRLSSDFYRGERLQRGVTLISVSNLSFLYLPSFGQAQIRTTDLLIALKSKIP